MWTEKMIPEDPHLYEHNGAVSSHSINIGAYSL